MAGARESNPTSGYFSMGLNTLKVPMELFAKNRAKLCGALREAGAGAGVVVLLQGGGDMGVCEGDSSDVGPIFRQVINYFTHFICTFNTNQRRATSTGRLACWSPTSTVRWKLRRGGACCTSPDCRRTMQSSWATSLRQQRSLLATFVSPTEVVTFYSCLQERYRVDEVRYIDEMPERLRALGGEAGPRLLLLEGPNTDRHQRCQYLWSGQAD